MRPTAVLDIGSSKIVCLYGSRTEDGGTVVHGAGVVPYAGYREGVFSDRDSLRDALRSAVQKAEQESCMRIRELTLTVPADFAQLHLADATITLGARPRVVLGTDVDKLIAVSLKRVKQPQNFVLMHSTPVFFMVGGTTSAELPEGVMADELSALVSHMYASEDYVREITESLDELGVELAACVSAQLGEAITLIPESERVRPAVLIDVGYMQTEVCVAENGALIGIGTLPVGGYHFANDLRFGLDISPEHAEQVKRRFDFSLAVEGRGEVLRTNEGTRRVSGSAISFIIEARAGELAVMLRAELDRLRVIASPHLFVHVSGGGLFMMRGATEYMREALGLALKKDMPWSPRLSTPNYCSAFGALDFVLHAAGGGQTGTAEETTVPRGKKLARKLFDFLTK